MCVILIIGDYDMVFRKPYAFLIKYFRLIHLIITGVLVYIVSQSNKIYSFINSCIDDPVNRYNAVDYIDYRIYIFIGVGLLLFAIIFWLFKYKDKPRNIYILSIFGYIASGIYLFLLYSYFSGLPNGIIDQKVIRAYRDIMLIILCFQYLIIIIMFVRGLGFDIKKFNFTKDIQELNITNEDGEEIEVDVNVDTNSIMRGIRKQKREFGYFLKEYRAFIIGILAIIVVSVMYFGYTYFSDKFKKYNQGESIGYINNLIIKNSYYNIDNDKNYIIVNFDISKYGVQEKFNVSNLVLTIGKDEYLANKNICNNFRKLGNCYKKQFITQDISSYIIVYEVDSINVENSYLIYKESYKNSFKVKLNLENYD